jgi:hypothetical protein
MHEIRRGLGPQAGHLAGDDRSHLHPGRVLPRPKRAALRPPPRRKRAPIALTMCFSGGGGIGLQDCAVTDDGVQ